MVLEVSKVSPRTWRSAVSRSFDELNSKERCLANALIIFAQNRHIGITPSLARSVALLVLNADQKSPLPEPWYFVFKRVLQQIDCLEKGRIDIEERVNMGRRLTGMLRAAPVYTLLKIILPVVELASRRLGRSMLFTESGDQVSPSLSEYMEYEQSLSDSISEISQNTDQSMDLFWAERSAILLSYSKLSRLRESDEGRLAELDVPSLAFLLRLKSKVRNVEVSNKPVQLPENEQQTQKILKQREGGVNGIKITRSLDEISGILNTELAFPPVMIADKLANSGYMIYERNPKKQENRDVLVAGLVSPDIYSENTLGWLKACWFETMARLSLILLKAKLTKSDLAWVYKNRAGVWGSYHYPIHKLSESGDVTNSYSKWYRGHFLTNLDWLPEFLSFPQIGNYKNGDEIDNPGLSGEALDKDKWVEEAWRSYVKGRVESDSGDGTVDGWASQYRYIHVMIFLPISLKEEGDAPSAVLSRYLHQLNLLAQSKRYVSIVWVPESFQSIADLSCFFSDGMLHLKTRMSHTAHDEEMITSWVVSGWMKNLTKEIWNG